VLITVFTDEVEITVQSGRGGDGIVSFRREKYVPKGGPDGGDGGAGGDIIFIADRRLRSLHQLKLKKFFKAENGKPGDKKNKTGARGKDCIIRVPVGTIIRDKETSRIIGDLTKDGQKLLLLKGGKGGYGNTHFASPVNRTPKISKPGQPGKNSELLLQLKMIADVGLVGFPNAGKSTLLSALTRARPKVGNYPFTTLHPNLGVMEFSNEKQVVIADIPGIIEGAHQGHGLGIRFLKHIERTNIVLFVIDLSDMGINRNQTGNFRKTYETLENELASYSGILAEKRRLIVGTKMDIVDYSRCEQFLSEFPDFETLTVSAATGSGVDKLKRKIVQLLEKKDEGKAD